MRALVLGGAGAMGRWTIRDLTESDGVDEVIAADLDGRRAREAAGWAAANAGSNGTARVHGMTLSAGDPQALRRALEHVDVVANCAYHTTNVPVMEACADTGTHYVDLGGLFHTTRRQLALHDRFAAAGVTAVPRRSRSASASPTSPGRRRPCGSRTRRTPCWTSSPCPPWSSAAAAWPPCRR
jgi:lysine 6-dehydrogenase